MPFEIKIEDKQVLIINNTMYNGMINRIFQGVIFGIRKIESYRRPVRSRPS